MSDNTTKRGKSLDDWRMRDLIGEIVCQSLNSYEDMSLTKFFTAPKASPRKLPNPIVAADLADGQGQYRVDGLLFLGLRSASP